MRELFSSLHITNQLFIIHSFFSSGLEALFYYPAGSALFIPADRVYSIRIQNRLFFLYGLSQWFLFILNMFFPYLYYQNDLKAATEGRSCVT